jgi:outer membrane protein assembly factor BamB
VIVFLQWIVFSLPRLFELPFMAQIACMFWAPMVATAAFLIWWMFFSRFRWSDRNLGLLMFLVTGVAAYGMFHPSYGIMGVIMSALPVVTTSWVAWIVVSRFLSWPDRRIGLLVVFVLAWGYFTLIRFDGVDGEFKSYTSFRWTPTAEDKYREELAAGRVGRAETVDAAAPALTLQPGDWPEFRGPNRDNRLTGVRIATDWQTNAPKPLWRHRVGPGWSSFAVVGTHLYTQEQLGEEEMVSCYDADTGALLWVHKDAARYTEPVAGPGPRATPTFHEGKLYTQGAAGNLNCLDALTGKVLWSHDIKADADVKEPPMWGFSASPLVVAGVVTTFAGGAGGKCVLGYDANSGKLAWSAGDGKLSFCSMQKAHLGGAEQLLISTDKGLTAFDPARGTVLWQHDWETKEVARIVQPAVLEGDDVVIGTGFDFGTRRIHVGRGSDGWSTQEVWTKTTFKPYYNDFVVHGGHLYGFDGLFFTCISLDSGERKWRERGYGNGQVLLLPDQDLLLILSEKGEVALVVAKPDARKEVARFQAIEGKTWNHPVLARGKLFVRNGEEMACYQLKEAIGESSQR